MKKVLKDCQIENWSVWSFYLFIECIFISHVFVEIIWGSGWDREGEREGDARGRRYRDICICIADSLCYRAETNTSL